MILPRTPFFHHILHHWTGAVGCGVQIEGNLAVPVVHGHIGKAAGGNLQGASGIIDQHVDMAENAR